MKILIIMVIVVLGIAGMYYWRSLTLKSDRVLSIEDKVDYYIEIKDEPVGMARGLSGREQLEENQGMLFVYPRPEKPLFWMKDMNFSLDFVWINDFKVVGLSENIPHPEANNGETYRLRPENPANMVLEINAGEIAKNGLKIGDSIKIITQ